MFTTDLVLHEISNKKSSYYPILGKDVNSLDFYEMDFSKNNTALFTQDLSSSKKISDYLFGKIKESGKKYGIGGYGEERPLYQRSAHFNNEDEPRTIHLGVDIWAKAETEIFCPYFGKVYSFKNNNVFGDYGPTIILEHILESTKIYSLYGHLSMDSITNLYIGKEFKAGEILCKIGDFPVNGDWPPHLHFQLIIDIGDSEGDYLGVCKKTEKEYYLQNCPDANLFLNFSE